MSYKTIVVLMQGMEDADKVLDCAIPFASRYGSHLIGVHAEPLPVAYTAAPMGFPDAAVLQASTEASRERGAALEARFVERLEGAAVSFEWRGMETVTGDTAHSSVSVARTADLIIAMQPHPDTAGEPTGDVESLMFEAGRPVLFAPYGRPFPVSCQRIAVAWNGSREAARATFDALPLICEAEMTEIFVVDAVEETTMDTVSSADDLAAALSRHGARVSVSHARSEGHSIETVIAHHTVEIRADLLVLGAYSHSWLREFLFGGVTRHILKSMPVATFTSR